MMTVKSVSNSYLGGGIKRKYLGIRYEGQKGRRKKKSVRDYWYYGEKGEFRRKISYFGFWEV